VSPTIHAKEIQDALAELNLLPRLFQFSEKDGVSEHLEPAVDLPAQRARVSHYAAAAKRA